MPDHKGNCQCGAVQYEVQGDPLQVVNCHCSLCRSMSGAAFSTYVVVREPAFKLVQGDSQLLVHQATERSTKHFCGSCGTPLFNLNPTAYRGLMMLYLGTLADHLSLAPRVDIFCESKLSWVGKLSPVAFEQAPASKTE